MLTALQGRIYYNPLVTGYEIKDRFIAGTVIEKVERIEAWMGDNPENERMPEVKQALEMCIRDRRQSLQKSPPWHVKSPASWARKRERKDISREADVYKRQPHICQTEDSQCQNRHLRL